VSTCPTPRLNLRFELRPSWNNIHDTLPSGTAQDTTYEYCRTPLIRKLVIRNADYPDWLGPSGKFVENSTKLISLEITGYPIKHSAVLWLLELQVRLGRKV